jgi:hypothetical protein
VAGDQTACDAKTHRGDPGVTAGSAPAEPIASAPAGGGLSPRYRARCYVELAHKLHLRARPIALLEQIMDRIDALRNIDDHPAVFLRYGNAGYVVIGVDGQEQTIERSDWLALPPWIPAPPKTPSGWIEY